MIKRISGLFFLSGEDAKFTLLKKIFGEGLSIRNNVGSLLIIEKRKTLNSLLDKLIENYHILQKSKINKIDIQINIAYEKDANWTVTPEQMNKLGFLNAVLCVSAYQAED